MLNNEKLKLAYQNALEFEKKEELIGIQQEKILHKTIKYYLDFDESHHEVKIKKSSKGIIYADIYDGNTIYEIQTRGFDKLREKLKELLNFYNVVLVHPIAYKKNIYKIEETGEIVGPIKSPKKGSIFEIFKELYKIKFLLNEPNLSIKIILCDMDEYRYVVVKKHYRSSGYIRERQIPTNIVSEINLNSIEDFKQLLLTFGLIDNFTSTDFARKTKITRQRAATALNVLTYMSVVERIGKEKNSYIYQIKK